MFTSADIALLWHSTVQCNVGVTAVCGATPSGVSLQLESQTWSASDDVWFHARVEYETAVWSQRHWQKFHDPTHSFVLSAARTKVDFPAPNIDHYNALHQSVTLSLSTSGCESLWWGVSHTGSPSAFGTIPCVLHREPQVLHVVLTTSVQRRRSISFSVFLDFVVHERLPRGFVWHSHLLLSVVYARTSSAW